MRTLTVRQPWASLIVSGVKRIETRGWRTPYRGEIAIHAGQTVDVREGARAQRFGLIDRPAEELPRGAILGTVTLVEIVHVETMLYGGLRGPRADLWVPLTERERALGDYTEGRYAWLLADPRPLAEPVSIRGALGLWSWEAERP